jgi:hypothetical protein
VIGWTVPDEEIGQQVKDIIGSETPFDFDC